MVPPPVQPGPTTETAAPIATAVGSLAEVSAAAWDAMVPPDNPFLEHSFLYALEATGCVGPGTGWEPCHLLLRSGPGAAGAGADVEAESDLLGALPLYLKTNSNGEYIFDWAWADAYHRAGVPYYPKLTAAVPFTPATGGRFLIAPGADEEAVGARLAAALADLVPAAPAPDSRAPDRVGDRSDSGMPPAPDASGAHVLYCTEAEQAALVEQGFLPRLSFQFHWENRDYRDWQDFLEDIRSKKRKQFRRERRAVADQGLRVELLTGSEITAEHMDAVWRFYVDTGRRKWGTPYLNRAFFDRLHRTMADRLVLVLAHDGSDWVGGSFNLRGEGVVYGRYWGALGAYDSLHFECCYYRLIEYAIAIGARRLEAGAQGEHKFLRGFAARPTYSAHWIALPQGREAIARFVAAEAAEVRSVIAAYNRQSPLKHLREAHA